MNLGIFNGATPRAYRVCALLGLLFYATTSCLAVPWFAKKFVADQAYQKKDYKKAFSLYMELATRGAQHDEAVSEVAAQFIVGWMYSQGEGVKKDISQAIKWWRMAGERGDVDAQNNLAKAYAQGLGATQDWSEAVKWARLAAEQGLVEEQSSLGWAYQNGKGVPQDLLESAMWYEIAASAKEQGSADDSTASYSRASLLEIQKQLTRSQIEEASRRASAWLEQARAKKAEKAAQVAAQIAAMSAPVPDYTGPSYTDIANQSLQNTIARQQAAIGLAQARQREIEATRQAQNDQNSRAAAEQAREAQLASAEAAQRELAVVAAAQQAKAASEQSRQTEQYPTVFRDECIGVTTKNEGRLLYLTFKNICSETLVIRAYAQRSDGTWDGGSEDCRAGGQWILDAIDGGTGRYIAHAQPVKSCTDEYLLKWPPAPK